MPADLVTLVVWRDVATDPPLLSIGTVIAETHSGTVKITNAYEIQRTTWYRRWCQVPVPPNADAPLTVKDVRWAARMADKEAVASISLYNRDMSTGVAARLRSALPKEVP